MSSSLAFDPTVWFQIQAASFQPLSFYGDWFSNGTDHTAVFMKITNVTDDGQQWQVYPVSSASYLIRCRLPGADFYLGTGGSYPTVPMMRTRKSVEHDASVIWDITSWGDGTFHLTNGANGTDYHLATNTSGTMFLDPDPTKKDSQRWSFKSVGTITATAFSSVQTPSLTSSGIETPSATTTSIAAPISTGMGGGSQADSSPSPAPTSTSDAAKPVQGLSSGGIAAIAVVVTLVVIALAAVAGFFVWRRRQRADTEAGRKLREPAWRWRPARKSSAPTHELYVKHKASVGELPAHELDSIKRVKHELPA